MKCFSLLLGARNTPSGGKEFSTADENRIRRITFRHFPSGFTILNADGGWFDPVRRKFIEESSRQILICAQNRSRLRRWCQELGAALQQKEFLIIELGAATSFRMQLARRKKRRRRTTTKRSEK
jgi:Protein of unknown function (DUF3574)